MIFYYCNFFPFPLSGRESKARELLALPWTNINAQYANGNTPLILAVQGKVNDIKDTVRVNHFLNNNN